MSNLVRQASARIALVIFVFGWFPHQAPAQALSRPMFPDPKICARRDYPPPWDFYESFCQGYAGRECYATRDSDACFQGAQAKASEERTGQLQRNDAALEKVRRELEKMPPLPPNANPLLGRWKPVMTATARPKGGLEEILAAMSPSNVACALLGGGDEFEFRPNALVQEGRVIESLQYRRGQNGVTYVLGERLYRLMGFEPAGADRVKWAGCTFQRVGSTAPEAAATSARGSAPPASQSTGPSVAAVTPTPPVSSRPPPEVCQRMMLDKLGVARVDEVRKAIGARFKETLTGTVPNTQNLRLDARGSECDDARINSTLYDFDTAGVLQSVTLVWNRPAGPAPAPIFTERAKTISILFNAPPPQSSGRLQTSTPERRIILQDMPERNVLLETHGAPK